MVVKGLIMYQNFKKMPKIGQKCENGPILMTKTLKMAKIRIPSLLFNPFTTMCALSAQKRVQGRSPWRVPRGEPGGKYVIEIDRGDLWLSNKTKFSFIGPLNRAINHFLV